MNWRDDPSDWHRQSIRKDALVRLFTKMEDERAKWVHRQWWRKLCPEDVIDHQIALLNEELDALRDVIYGK